MWKKKKEQKAQQSGDAFTTSVSDLMAGLLSIFILALCYFMLNFQTVTNKYTGNTELRNQLLKDVGKDLQAQGLQVRIDTKQGVLRIPESVLFESGEANIKEQGQAAVGKLSQSLLKTMTRPEYREAWKQFSLKAIRTMFPSTTSFSSPTGNFPHSGPSIPGTLCGMMYRNSTGW